MFDGTAASLEISDTGSAIPADLAQTLLRAPLSNTRGGGFGIGLFQAAKQAEQAGYALTLASNATGEVTFLLAIAGAPVETQG